MNELISDASKFEKLCDPVDRYTVRMEDKFNRLLRKLKDCDAISDLVYESLYVFGASPGILYGLPKIHKPDFSSKFQFRPIFSAINTPCYKLANTLFRYFLSLALISSQKIIPIDLLKIWTV